VKGEHLTALIYFIVIITVFSLITLVMRLGTDRGMSPLGLTTVVSMSSAVMVLAAVLVSRRPVNFTLFCSLLAAAGGVCGITAFLFFTKAAQIGNYAFSVSVFQLSFLIPVVFSVIAWKEKIGPFRILGICLIILSLLLITSSSSGEKKPSSGKWLLFAVSSFFINGGNGICQSTAARFGSDLLAYLLVTYLAGGILLFIFSAGRKMLGGRVFLFGTAGAACSLIGNFLTLKLLTTYPPAGVFPVTLTGPVIVSTIVSAIVFREKIRKAGYAGIFLGAAGIALLSI